MRPTFPRAARTPVLAGALLLTGSAAAVADAAISQSTGGPSAHAASASVPRALRAGQPIDVHATVPASLAGRRALLEQQQRGETAWRSLAEGPVDPAGRVRLQAPAQRSGLVRVTADPGAADAADTSPSFVSVGGLLSIGARRLAVLEGSPAWLKGTLAPGGAGRPVLLQTGAPRHWHTVAAARTDGAGHYRLSTRPRAAGFTRLRVLFPGDAQNGPTAHGVAPLEVFRPAFVSTFGGNDGLDGSALACGGSLSSSTLGVASRTLPCGTKVNLRYRGHEVRVPVVDRGPYVGGREFDLTSGTAARLHFSGTGNVWTTA